MAEPLRREIVDNENVVGLFVFRWVMSRAEDARVFVEVEWGVDCARTFERHSVWD